MKRILLFILLIAYAGFTPLAEAQQNPYFSGSGGKGMSLAILVPEGKGISQDQHYLPTMVQGVFVMDISKYSAISVLDRQNLEKVLRETESGIYQNEQDFVQLGTLAHVGFTLGGTITKTSSSYALQIQIVDTKFYNRGLTSVVIPPSVTAIEDGAFANTQLTSVVMPANVSVGGVNVFDQAYNNNGKKAGTYTRANANSDNWSYKP